MRNANPSNWKLTMPQEFDIACPSCNAVFSVPCELAGEVAECAECDAVFKIPPPPTGGGGFQLPKADSGAVLGMAGADNFAGEVTHTVKLSRTSIGMIPTLKDSFKFDAPSPTASRSLPPPGAAMPRKPMLQRPASPATPPPPPVAAAAPPPLPPAGKAPAALPLPPAAPPAPPAAAAAAPPPPTAAAAGRGRYVEIPEWTDIKLRRDEEALGVHQVEDRSIGLALLVAAPVLVAGICALIPSFGIRLILVGVLCIVTFGAAAFMLRRWCRQCLVLTTARAIAIIGGKRIEVKK